ncbi:hypothetical protein VTO42DRAFT_4282 [Malbranchea cinnamomea]
MNPSGYPQRSSTSPSRLSASSAVSPHARPNEDWTKISDLTERRRIQNRIAQRNYRQKMKQRSQGRTPIPSDASHGKSSGPRERDMTTQILSRYSTARANKVVYATRSPFQTPVARGQSDDNKALPQAELRPSLKYYDAFGTASNETWLYTESSTHPMAYGNPTYANFPRQGGNSAYSPDNLPHASFPEPQFSSIGPQFYTPTEDPLPYNLEYDVSPEPQGQFPPSEIYVPLDPFPYETPSDGPTFRP